MGRSKVKGSSDEDNITDIQLVKTPKCIHVKYLYTHTYISMFVLYIHKEPFQVIARFKYFAMDRLTTKSLNFLDSMCI